MKSPHYPEKLMIIPGKMILLLALVSCTGTQQLRQTGRSEEPKHAAQASSPVKTTVTLDAHASVAGSPVSSEMQDYLMTRDIRTGEVPLRKLWDAWQQTKAFRDDKGTTPSDIYWEERGPSNVGGRTRSIMFDPNDATHKKAWAGSVSGGLWYTNDITAAPPLWNKVDDFWERLPIGCLAYDPTNTSIFYAGTGEGWSAGGGLIGAGIYRSTDGGTTWDTVTSTFFTGDFKQVFDIVVHPVTGYVYAATRGYNENTQGGILRSKDHGTTWEVVLNKTTAPTASPSNNGMDLEIASDNYIYATMGLHESGGIFRSLTGNAGDWTSISTGINIPETKRIELAVSASSPATLYCAAQDTTDDNDIQGIYRSTNRGNSWTAVTIPMRDGSTSFATGQAGYDLILAVHPTDPNLVYAAGVKMYKSTNGGASWKKIRGIHDDHHMIVSRPGFNNEMAFGNDGGIYYTADCMADDPVVLNKNNGYNVTQFYTLAYHPDCFEEYMLGGTQDNGTPRFQYPGINATTEANNGDGAYCHISQLNPSNMITARQWNNYYRSRNGGESYRFLGSGVVRSWLIPPAIYDDGADVLYSSYNADSLLRIRNYMGDYQFEYLTGMNFGGTPSAFALSPFASNLLTIGTQYGRIFRLENANSPSDWDLYEMNTAALPDGNIASFDYGSSFRQMLLVFSNYGMTSVWETTDGGVNWSPKEGNLPDMPIRWGIYNPYDYKQVLVATEIGVWTTEDITVPDPVWVPCNGGLANVRVSRLELRKSDMTLFAATFGRGIYTSTSLNAIPHQKVTAGDASDSCHFGCSVDISGNYAIAGAYGDNDNKGAAYILKFNGNEWTQTAKLTASNGIPGDRFGIRVTTDGQYAVIGAVYDKDNGTESGAAYVFSRSSETWTQQAKIKASDGAAGDRFGSSVTKYGDYIAVGAVGDDPVGSVYIFKLSANVWTQTRKLTPGAGTPANFGISVSMYKDTLTVGCCGLTTENGHLLVYVRNGEDWLLKKEFDDYHTGSRMGTDVSAMGGLYVAGADNADCEVADHSGGAYCFRKTSSGWTSYPMLYAPDSWSYYTTGRAVDLYDTYVIAGSPYDWNTRLNGGSASIFRYSDGHWNFFMKLFPDDLDPDDHFGSDVALSSQYAMIGSPEDDTPHGKNSGSVYFFRNYTSGLSQPDLSAVPLHRNVPAWASSADINVYNIGTGLMDWTATSNDPWLTITGGSSGTDDGTVHVVFAANSYCQRTGTITIEAPGALHSPKIVEITQTATGAEEQLKIEPAELIAGDYFGYSVAIDDNCAVIGAYGDDDKASGAGAIYIYEYDGVAWNKKATLYASDPAASDYFGIDVAISEDIVVAGAYNKNGGTGAAYVFKKPSTGWHSMTATAKLTAGDGTSGDNFGRNVAISGDYLAVTAPGHGQGVGAVYFFDRPMSGWTGMTETDMMVGHGAVAGDHFACDVALSGEYAVVGSYNDDGKGSAYLFRRAWVWTEYAKLTASDGAAGDDFGYSVDMWGANIIAGAYMDDAGRGSAYLYKRPESGWTDMTETYKLTAPDRAASDYFGIAVGVHDNNALVGAYMDDDHGSASGSAYGYIFNDTTQWLEEKIVATDGLAGDYLGRAVDLSYQYSILGAYGRDDKGSSSGAAYVYCNSCDTICTPEMTVDPAVTVNIPETEGTDTVYIANTGNCTFNWKGRSSASWLTILGDSTGAPPGSVRVHYDANPGNARTAQLAILSTEAFNAPEYVTFSQAHGPDIIPDPDSVHAGETVCWFASNSITVPSVGSWYVIDSAASVELVAGKQISLDPLFHSRNGSHCHAYISDTPCTPASLVQGSATAATTGTLAPEPSGTDGIPPLFLFPNPADDRVTVYLDPSFNGSQVAVEMFDVMGRKALQISQTCNGNLFLGIASLPPGVYVTIIRIDGNRRFTGKLVVN